MNLTEQAVQQLTEIITSNVNDIESVETPLAVITEKMQLRSLEEFKTSPSAHRSKFNTGNIGQFIIYTQQNILDSTTIYIDPDTFQAKAIFDHGDISMPEWGHHTATLTLKQTAPYQAILKAQETPFTQRELLDYIEDWGQGIEDQGDYIGFYNADQELISKPHAINSLQRLTVNTNKSSETVQGNLNQEHGDLESIEIKSGQNTPPAYFQFTCTPYNEFNPITLKCSLRYLFKEDPIKIKYRIASLDIVQDNLAIEFNEIIQSKIEKANIYIGTVQHQNK